MGAAATGGERPRLIGRGAECEALDALLAEALSGRSRVIVLRGEAGVGKTALLDHLADRAAGWHVATAAGVESEMELDYAVLHRLCAPMLDRAQRLPDPQRDALTTVFGLSAGRATTRFLVALATLRLFADVADEQPLLCIVDDAHWVDQASAQVLGFIGRRLQAGRIALVCATRSSAGDDILDGLPALSVGGLGESDARTLLLQNVRGPLDSAVCQQVVTESHGNPLALLELPRAWSPAPLAGGFGLPDSQPIARRIEQSYARRLRRLPSATQLLVRAAAAEPLGDPALLHRAAERLGLDLAAADPAVDAGLLTVGSRVLFAHPLARSAAYRSAAAEDRHRVHRALAEATDPERDPDRRAWHRARAAHGPDEQVAAELERSAGRAQDRGGLAAAAAFLDRAVALTVDPRRRTERALAAAQANLRAGAFDAGLRLLATAAADASHVFDCARVELLRGQVGLASGRGTDAPSLLLQAARRLEPFDLDLARETYLTAWGAVVNDRCGADRSDVLVVCQAIRGLPPSLGGRRALDLLLDGLALLTTEGRAAATPVLQRAAEMLAEISNEDVLRWGWAAVGASAAVWDDEGFHRIAQRQVEVVREAGALAPLLHFTALGLARAWTGDFAGAAALVAEANSVAASTGSRFAPFVSLRLTALQGREPEASSEIASALEQAAAGGQRIAAAQAGWAAAVLFNGLARYDEALAAAAPVTSDPVEPWISTWALAELIEAATRSGRAEHAEEALARLAETTRPSGTDFALGIEARCRALLSHGPEAERSYAEAIERLGRTRLRPELARAHLLYGEWLRREGRRVDARDQLRTAGKMLAAIGMEAFAQRAERELRVTGARARKRKPETRDELTPQEAQIARLAQGRLSNVQIGAMLFLSPRTVEWHLRKVFAKLGIDSRYALRTAMPPSGDNVTL